MPMTPNPKRILELTLELPNGARVTATYGEWIAGIMSVLPGPVQESVAARVQAVKKTVIKAPTQHVIVPGVDARGKIGG